MNAQSTPTSRSTPAQLGAVSILSAAISAAGIFAIGRSTSTFEETLVWNGVLFVGLSLLAIVALRNRRQLAMATVLASGSVFLVTGAATEALSSNVDRRIDDQLVLAGETTTPVRAAVPAPEPAGRPALLAQGRLRSLAHEVSGRVSIVKTSNGRRQLQLENFRTESGPDLYVIAVRGNPSSDDDVRRYTTIGRLRGTSGNQVYRLPRNFDADQYSHVYIWCRAFTVGFGRAAI